MDRDGTMARVRPPDRWPGDQNPDVSASAKRLGADNRHARRFARSDGALPRSPDQQYHAVAPASERNVAVSWVIVSYTFGYRNLAGRMP